ncbi:MAG: hypothetical protein A2X17_06550 [Bacteroidetes bacterium GWF2_41_61]|nr:MAG: hypothetical protein A2X20_07985 [Bacteroidetes bacterium GWE2_40_15]OFY36084.1 MAG: hypothetical protein A2X17_06550 [Bacteroidetes bacterium GWF2_41_61]HBG23767.1 hypothetical protein [Rikenellaceae bacterium]HBZ25984.1 hypothetical protein [Rikenellaceae bacterium]
MKNINSKKDLEKAIYALAQLQSAQGELLKAQFERSIESLKPVNIIKNSFNNMVKSPDLLKNIISTSVGLTSGYVSNKIFVGNSRNIIRKFIGGIIQVGVTTIVSSNPEAVKRVGHKIIGTIFHRGSQKK